MLSQELYSLVKRIEIKTNKIVDTVLSGQYSSAFKGQGMEFAEVREYVPGDDIRNIDWNVTARSGFPHVKLFHEERELSVFFVVDVSSSLLYGSGEKLKSEIAAEVCSILAFSAIQNNDNVGMMLVSDNVEKLIPLKRGRQHVLRLVREILSFETKKSKTALKEGLEHLSRMLTKKTVIFVMSDFKDQTFQQPLSVLSRKHDVIAMNFFDRMEVEIPDVGELVFEDLESGEAIKINTSNKSFRKAYQSESKLFFDELDRFFKSQGIDYLEIDVRESYMQSLIQLFRKRENH